VEPESAVSFSSGGFSDRFPRPYYQEYAVKGYLNKLGGQWAGLYNPSGRGFPDVSAQGSQFHFIENGAESFVGGTSASAPTFSAFISQVNSALISAQKPPLGFLNPWLYAIGKGGLTDITHGGSTGCTGLDQYSNLTTPIVPYASWNATKGWDPVTGLGTPKLQELIKLALHGGGSGRNYIDSE
jgi:tripeptidyl-peptidase I